MNFLCRKPRQDASTGAFDLRHRPTATANTPPARRNDDASISISSWANIDTEKAAATNHRGLADRRHASDSKISYDHHQSSRRMKSHQTRPAKPEKPSSMKASDDAASISMSSWANISVGKISDGNNAHDRLFHSDSAIRYNGPTDITIATKPTSKHNTATVASHHNHKSGGTEHGCNSQDHSVNVTHSRETSWGNVDVLGMLGDIEKAREVAAKDILERRDLSERRRASGSSSRRITAPPAAADIKNDSSSLRGKIPPVDRVAQRKSMRPPLAGGPNRRTASTRTRTQRV